jgi:hypothetical protein
MIAFLSSLSSVVRRARLGRALLLVALALPVGAVAQEQSQFPKEMSEKVSDGLTKVKPLLDAKNWDGALALIADLLKIAAPGGSYEEAVLNGVQGQIYLQKSEYSKAIAPMETALRLSDLHNYYDAKYEADLARILFQLYYQEAVTPHLPKDQQQAYFVKAGSFIKRVIDSAGAKPNPEDIILYASILYNRASATDKIDMALVKEAQTAVEGALLSVLKPKQQYYEFLLATLTQQSDYVRATEILELLVKMNPTSTAYWPQLAAMYLALGNEPKQKELALEYNVRAIVTIERAQAVGQMKSPKDNFNLISIYLLIGQFDQACAMLDAGLRDGTVDQEQKNWELLAYYYQQVDKQNKAIDILKLASSRFPKTGLLDFQAAQIYYSIDKLDDAYSEARLATTKNLGDKGAPVWQFVAYCAFEQRKYSEALEAVDNAIAAEKVKGGKKDASLPRLKQAIEESIKERDASAEALKAKQKL